MLIAGLVELRRGEVLGLERRHVDILHQTLMVDQQQQELSTGKFHVGPPKTDAGRRKIALPGLVSAEVELHLIDFVAPGKRGRMFVGEKGGPLRSMVLHKHWVIARESAGLPEGFTPLGEADRRARP